jgi:hypothetical protein
MSYQADIIFEQELTPKKGAKIPFGIHSKCKVTSLDVTEEYVDINFEDSEGRYNNKRLWQPKGNYPQDIKLDGGATRKETEEEAKTREEKANISHVVKVLHIFLGSEKLKNIKGNSYLDFMQNAAKALTPSVLSSKLVNLKLIYDKEGVYAVFGNFPDYVEENTNEEPKLSFSKWEKENRCTPASESPKSSTDTALTDLFKPR